MSNEDSEEDNKSAPKVSELGLDPSTQETDSAVPDGQLQTVDQKASASQAERKEKPCSVCNVEVSKYKCSRCYIPYCSIVCSVSHKATHPAIESPPSSKVEPVVALRKDNTTPRLGTLAAAGHRGPFAELDGSKKLQTLFNLYPTLPSLLLEIHSATLRPPDENNINSQYHGGKGKYQSHRKVWNQDRGVQDGIEALRQARQLGGKDGEGVREYSQLVLQTLSMDDAVDAEAHIQKELAEEDARIVSLLLNGER